MASSGKRPRKPKKKLPPVPKYVRYPRDSGTRWRLGGPLTNAHEAEAKAAERAKQPGKLARLVLRMLGSERRSRP